MNRIAKAGVEVEMLYAPPKKRLFPLHLTPFENYMLWDDRPNYPMAFLVQFTFSGRLIKEAFLTALDDTVVRHPLMRAIIRPAKQNRDCWVNAPESEPSVDWGDLDDPINLPDGDGEHIDLRNEVGLRIWVRCNDERAVVTFQFHHCVCDGIGSYQFLGDLLYSYHRHCGAALVDVPSPGELEASNLRSRLRAMYNPDHYRAENGKFSIEWGEVARLAFQQISPLKVKNPRRAHEHYPFPGIQSYSFDRDDYRSIRLAAQDRGQTANDFLTEKLFLTLKRWNERQGKRRGSYCVLLPMDVREPSANVIPATNIVTFAFLRRRKGVLRRPEQLTKGLREEMTELKRNRHKTRFANVIAGAERFPQMLRRLLFGDRCLATAILSNTGDPTRRFHVDFPRQKGAVQCGNLVLEDIAGVPPMRPKTRVAMSIFTYRRVLKICLRCDPHLFTEEHTRQLLDLFVATVTEDVAQASSL